MATKFIIDHEDAIQAIRKQYCIPSTVEIVVNWKETPVSGDDEWIDVPSDWENDFPPPETEQYNKIEIMMRRGYTDVGAPEDFDIFWMQENDIYDIIKWRPVK